MHASFYLQHIVFLILDFINENGEQRGLFGFRIHHMIGDGYSMLGFLQNVFDQASTPPASLPPKHKPMGVKGKFKMWFWMPLSWWADVKGNCFHSDYFTTRKCAKKLSWLKTSVNLSELKLIRKNLSSAVKTPVSLITVILFLFGTALRKTLFFDSMEGRRKLRVPSRTLNTLKVGIAMPRSSPHPEGTFSNHWQVLETFFQYMREGHTNKRFSTYKNHFYRKLILTLVNTSMRV